ncbi:hypothetical protein J4447_03770 [Candidatus Pacearchaeota archaeon]|nr:hypothetical protein [Candidatus Pacearchaeota archaeon]
MIDWLQLIQGIIGAGIGGTIVGIISQHQSNKRLAIYNLVNESQFKAFSELWRSLMNLKRKGEDLWQEANERWLSEFVKYIEEAHISLQDNALILDKKEYEDLKKILDQFWHYRVGKERLIEMDNKKIQQKISYLSGSIVISDERQNQVFSNESIKKEYEKLLDDLREKFQAKMGIK